jgi:hypothetical protein
VCDELFLHGIGSDISPIETGDRYLENSPVKVNGSLRISMRSFEKLIDK